jgi:D-alanine-D-alanine ligase
MAKLRVAVLFGGRSGEHEISIRSAASVIAALDRQRYTVIPAAIDKRGLWLPPAASAALLPAESRQDLSTDQELRIDPQPGQSLGADVVFTVLHGTFGEDGTVQGLLELADVAYVGSGVLGSSCGMDKDVMKRLFRERGLPSVDHISLLRQEIDLRWREPAERFGYPLFVKPANLGSSVGISKANNEAELRESLEQAAQYDRKLVVEPAIDGREIELAVLGNDQPEASIAGEIIPTSGFYSYDSKYLDDSAKLEIPAQITAEQLAEAQRLAVGAFQAVNCRGLARVDFFLERQTGRFLLNEINTMPGFTSISMYPKLWEASGLPYARLVNRLIELALERQTEKQTIRFER